MPDRLSVPGRLALLVVAWAGCGGSGDAGSLDCQSQIPTAPATASENVPEGNQGMAIDTGPSETLKPGPGQSEGSFEDDPIAPFSFASTEAVESHVNHLLTMLKTHEREKGQSPIDLSDLLQSCLVFAEKRSIHSRPQEENVAALISLGIVAGDPRLGWVAKFSPNREISAEIRRLGKKVRLHNRRDFAQHFCISAAMAAVSNEVLSNMLGQFKEEVDAGECGSGFSFADLAADQAGSRFGVKATRDEESAKIMQRQLAKGCSSRAFMPEIEGLPEQISAAGLQTEYGGRQGAGFKRMQEEIRSRINRCSLLRDESRTE